ncbi:MAG: VWA domain-containing protein, partial [Terracoccus sp.]
LCAVWWNPSSRSAPGESRGSHWRRTAAVLLLAVAATRPAVPGDTAEASAANLNVYFVVDTTTSIVAEDYGSGVPRLTGVRRDIAAIARALPGARYSILTFDQAARVRLPLTTDTTALSAALETLLPEPSEVSKGSSVTEADGRLTTALAQSEQRHPDRARIVYYLGDGEQTSGSAPAPFTVPATAVNGGAVLGYGTTEGGRMLTYRSRFDRTGAYVRDPTTGEDALSMIDETQLTAIGTQLGLPYLHRASGEPIAPAVDGIDLARFGTSPQIEAAQVRARRELYWPLLLGLAGVAVWEVGASSAALASMRRRRGETP